MATEYVPTDQILYGLLHDAAEALTGDVRVPYKTEAQRILETHILFAVFRRFNINPPSSRVQDVVERKDKEVGGAEADFIGIFPSRLPDINEGAYLIVRAVLGLTAESQKRLWAGLVRLCQMCEDLKSNEEAYKRAEEGDRDAH
jgi:hypothetical protein